MSRRCVFLSKIVHSLCLASVVITAHAGAFSLYTESSATAIGNYAAGIAAEANDAAIGWYNPAGLVLIKEPQLVVGGAGVFPKSQLSGQASYQSPIDPLPGGPLTYQQSFVDLNGAREAVVPFVHYARPLANGLAFGLSVVSPFGLSTDWGEHSPLRYSATYTEMKTLTIAPELGANLTPHLSLGAGLDLQYARVTFNTVVGAPALLDFLAGFDPSISATQYDSLSYNTGDSFGIGMHAGILALFNEAHTRFGINYQSKIEHIFQGYSRLSGPLASGGNVFDPSSFNPEAVLQSNVLRSSPINLPDMLTLSLYQDLNPHLALLGSIVYTGWAKFKTIGLINIAAPVPNAVGDLSPGIANIDSVKNFKNTARFALGANYRLNELWAFRIGTGFDQSPTNNIDRDVRLPDADRIAIALGAHYQMYKNLGLDLGYSFLFAYQDPTINRSDLVGPSLVTVNAKADTHVSLIGAQLVWMMG